MVLRGVVGPSCCADKSKKIRECSTNRQSMSRERWSDVLLGGPFRGVSRRTGQIMYLLRDAMSSFCECMVALFACLCTNLGFLRLHGRACSFLNISP